MSTPDFVGSAGAAGDLPRRRVFRWLWVGCGLLIIGFGCLVGAVVAAALGATTAGGALLTVAVSLAVVAFLSVFVGWRKSVKYRDSVRQLFPSTSTSDGTFLHACVVAPYPEHGPFVAVRKRTGFVAVTDGYLGIGDSTFQERCPLPQLHVGTAGPQRKLGASTIVHINGQRWIIDFGLVTTPKDARRANEQFRRLLLEGGATDLQSTG